MSRRLNPKLPSPRDVAIFERVMIRGERQTTLAAEFGLSKQRVNRICQRVGKLVFLELAEDFSDHRRQTILRLEHIYSEALTAWEKSKSGRVSETESTNGAGDAVRSTTRTTAAGDVRYLTEARQAMADLRELCGLDATKTEVLELRESRCVEIDVTKMSDDELEKLAVLYDLACEGVIQVAEAS